MNIWEQVPEHKLVMTKDWTIYWTIYDRFLPEISHNDIIEYEDGTLEIFKEEHNYSPLRIVYEQDILVWIIDLTWHCHYDEEAEGYVDGDYYLRIEKEDPEVINIYNIAWIRYVTRDKRFAFDNIINDAIKCIENQDMEGLQKIKDKWHMPESDFNEIEYWKDPEKYDEEFSKEYLKKPFMRHGDLGIDISFIVKKISALCIRKKYITLEIRLSEMKDLADEVQKNGYEIGKQILDIAIEIQKYLCKTQLDQGKGDEDHITEEQRKYIKAKLEPMRQYLYDKYA